MAQEGKLERNVSSAKLREILEKAQNKTIVDNKQTEEQLLKGEVKE